MSNKMINGLLIGMTLFLVCVFVAFAMAVGSGIDKRQAFHNECLADPKYDKFQCHSMIYGDR